MRITHDHVHARSRARLHARRERADLSSVLGVETRLVALADARALNAVPWFSESKTVFGVRVRVLGFRVHGRSFGSESGPGGSRVRPSLAPQ